MSNKMPWDIDGEKILDLILRNKIKQGIYKTGDKLSKILVTQNDYELLLLYLVCRHVRLEEELLGEFGVAYDTLLSLTRRIIELEMGCPAKGITEEDLCIAATMLERAVKMEKLRRDGCIILPEPVSILDREMRTQLTSEGLKLVDEEVSSGKIHPNDPTVLEVYKTGGHHYQISEEGEEQ